MLKSDEKSRTKRTTRCFWDLFLKSGNETVERSMNSAICLNDNTVEGPMEVSSEGVIFGVFLCEKQFELSVWGVVGVEGEKWIMDCQVRDDGLTKRNKEVRSKMFVQVVRFMRDNEVMTVQFVHQPSVDAVMPGCVVVLRVVRA